MAPRAWLRRAGVAVPLVALALCLGAGAASAHSYFVESDPADGAILARAPSRVVLVFSSAVTADFTTADLVEAHGMRYQATSVVTDRAVPNVVTVGLPQVPKGSYRLTFVTRDRVDLHQTAGTVVFGVGVVPGTASSAPQPAPARPAEFVLRWLGLAGLTVVLGGLLIALLVAPRLPDRGQQCRVQAALFGLALGGGVVQLFSGTALLAVQGASLGPDLTRTVPRLVTGSEYGSRWLVSTMLSVALTLFIAVLWRRAARGGVAGLAQEFRRLGPLALLSSQARTVMLAVALTTTAAVSGHAAGAAGLTAGEVVLRTTHLLSVGLWAGGVIALTVALLVLRACERSGEGIRRLVLGFGPYAAVGFALLGVTGLLLSGTQVASLTALLSTSYGLVLVAKVAAAALVATVALRHALFTWRSLGRRSPAGRLPRALLPTVALEGGGALAVILLAAVLGSSAPARGPQFDPKPPTPPATQVTRQSGELVTAVTLKPNRRGPNLLSVQVVDSRRPPLAAITGVTVLLRHPGSPAAGEPLATTRSGSRFDAGTVDLSAGDLQIGVVVHRSALTDSVIEVPWSVGGAEVPRVPTVISAEPLAPAVELGAVVLALAAGLVLLCGVMRYRLGDGPRGAAHLQEGDRPVRRGILGPGRTFPGIPGLNRTNGP
jgi:copper transport protein